ncbi:MAG: hypothetical protein PVH17_11570, partial [Anaerolineae bacterium]
MPTENHSHNLLIVSDMHIAEGLLAENGESAYGYEAFLYDGAFARFLRHHEQMRRNAARRWQERKIARDQGERIDEEAQRQDELLKRPWRLVLAGDVFDFWDIVRVPGNLEVLQEAIKAKQQELGSQPTALKWLDTLRQRLDDVDAGRSVDPWEYDHIRGELDKLNLTDGPQRRAVEDLTWWAEILVQKPGARLTRRERRHGLGTLWQEVVWKLTHVYRGHREFFAALAWFIACGNEVILLKGNHDVELHWPQVHDGHFPHVLTDVYRDLCGGGAVGPAFDDYPPEMLKGLPDPPSFETLLPQRFTFEDWFYYERDLVYVEHGNQYEPADSSVYFLAPVMPSDPKRIELPWGAFMVRYFYNKIIAIHPFAVNV